MFHIILCYIVFYHIILISIGRHISVRAEVDGKKVMRPYTPTSRPDQKGYFDILVKCYDLGKEHMCMHIDRGEGVYCRCVYMYLKVY